MSARMQWAVLALCLALLAGCGGADERTASGDGVPSSEAQLAQRLSGTVRIDGPQVLQPLGSAAARNFELETPVEVEVGEAGTEIALARLCSGRVAIAGARRPLSAHERQACARQGIELERLKIANHVVAVLAGEGLDIGCLTMGQLRELWRSGSRVTRYRQLGESLPSKGLKLYGPAVGRDSFALFTRLVNGEAGAIRSRWDAVENRNVLAARLKESSRALAFYNLAQVAPVSDARLVAVDDGEGCVKPTKRNVQAGRYPLREELYLYVSKPQLEHLRVRSFLRFFLENYDQLAQTAPSTSPASEQEIARAKRRLPAAEIPAG